MSLVPSVQPIVALKDEMAQICVDFPPDVCVHLGQCPVPRLDYTSTEGSCPSCLDLIIFVVRLLSLSLITDPKLWTDPSQPSPSYS